jgi:hypothetical protein
MCSTVDIVRTKNKERRTKNGTGNGEDGTERRNGNDGTRTTERERRNGNDGTRTTEPERRIGDEDAAHLLGDPLTNPLGTLNLNLNFEL